MTNLVAIVWVVVIWDSVLFLYGPAQFLRLDHRSDLFHFHYRFCRLRYERVIQLCVVHHKALMYNLKSVYMIN